MFDAINKGKKAFLRPNSCLASFYGIVLHKILHLYHGSKLCPYQQCSETIINYEVVLEGGEELRK
jgi:hypothetical protein